MGAIAPPGSAPVAAEAIFEKSVQTVVGMIHAQLTRTEKMAFHEKYHVLMNDSQDRKIGPVYSGPQPADIFGVNDCNLLYLTTKHVFVNFWEGGGVIFSVASCGCEPSAVIHREY